MFSAVGTHNYFKAKQEISESMEDQVAMAKLRASTVLPSLIWNFATASINDFANAELRSEFISGLIVADSHETLFAGVTNANNEIVHESLERFPSDQRQMAFDLIFRESGDNSKVGRVSIRYNELYLQQHLDEILFQQVLQSFVYCIVLFVLIWLLINGLVLTPLLNLNARLHNITEEISQR